jgi:hypothetical protein
MNRPNIGRVWASQNQVARRDPGDAKYGLGWIAEIPTLQVLNFLQYRTDSFLLALAERGVTSWGADIDYGLGSLAFDDLDGTIYVSIVNTPSKTNPPSLNTDEWVKSSVQISKVDYDSISKSITDHINNFSNPHKLTTNLLNTLSTTEIDALVSTYRNLVSNHVQNKENPHEVSAAQIGAVPVTGGEYSGPVTFKTNSIAFTNGDSVYSDNKALHFKTKYNTSLDINYTGSPTVTSSGVTSEIILSSTYPDYRATQESLYNVGTPIFYQPLMSGLSILIGDGTCDTGSWVPSFNNGLVFGVGSVSYDSNILTGDFATLSFDAYSELSGAANSSLTITSGALSVGISGVGNVLLNGNDTGSIVSSGNNTLAMSMGYPGGVPYSENLLGRAINMGPTTSASMSSSQANLNSSEETQDLLLELTLTCDVDTTVYVDLRSRAGNTISRHPLTFDGNSSINIKANTPTYLSATTSTANFSSGAYIFVSKTDSSNTGSMSGKNLSIKTKQKIVTNLYLNGLPIGVSKTGKFGTLSISGVGDSKIVLSNIKMWDSAFTNKQVTNI